MSKRKLPFGYEIRGGVIIKERTEAETVTDIYSLYISGVSFGEITDKLLKGNVVYDRDRAWNKNIVARILEDKRYVGDDVYPQIISGEEYARVLELREQKMYRADETAVQKYLRRLCDRKATEYIESETLRLLNLLIRNPEIIRVLDARTDYLSVLFTNGKSLVLYSSDLSQETRSLCRPPVFGG